MTAGQLFYSMYLGEQAWGSWIAGLDGKYMRFKSDSVNFWRVSWEAGMKFQGCVLGNIGTAQDRKERRARMSYLMVHLCFHIGQRNGHSTTLSTPMICTVIPPFSIHAKFWWKLLWCFGCWQTFLPWTDSLTSSISLAFVAFWCGVANFDFFPLSAACFHKTEFTSE